MHSDDHRSRNFHSISAKSDFHGSTATSRKSARSGFRGSSASRKKSYGGASSVYSSYTKRTASEFRDNSLSPSEFSHSEVAKPEAKTKCVMCVLISVIVCSVSLTCAGLAVSALTIIRTNDSPRSGGQLMRNNIDELRALLSATVELKSMAIAAAENERREADILSQIFYLGRRQDQPASSCLHVLQSISSPPSGYYWVTASNGSAVRVFCDMTRSCGGVTGGWTKVAYFDNSLASGHSCPGNTITRAPVGVGHQYCDIGFIGCGSATFDTLGLPYNRVCGRVFGYQAGLLNAFKRGPSEQVIDSNYVDGVSLTYGRNPRKHIWTFAAAQNEYGPSDSICECSHHSRPGSSPPGFVGTDYFCDSAIHFPTAVINIPRGSFPLWDGTGCGPNSTCCAFNNPPWFHRQLPESTTDDIEMRLCKNQPSFNERILLAKLEIYVQ